VEHDHDVRAGLERFDITGLLVAAVPLIFAMQKHAEPELARHFHRGVGGDIVDDEAFLDAPWRDVAKRLLDGPAGIVGRHDGYDFRCGHWAG
jgi:hypothetical protein